ncbi:ELWxxDGT repeat protein [Archangium primigenium]|uniref:ELWxxDGT repeat protein n=1 Tax=[Archangium] primigenium TaxID=2792470 RepID=UPI0019560820|nr:ELWxxDGT repeat protein [Archangium primigenium]MBM7117763.1 tandem-95 repeat protein [Archangium primigenium]
MRWLRYAVVVLAVVACSRPEPVPPVETMPSVSREVAGSSRAGLVSASARLVKDINPRTASANPRELTNIQGTVYFSASDGMTGSELWKSDGTAAGTVLLKDIHPGPGDSAPRNLINVNGTLYFSATNGIHGHELWKSDGTAAGTVLVQDIFPGADGSDPNQLTDVNGTLFFSATNGTHGYEVWKSDGTAAGTVLLKDIFPGQVHSSPSSLTNVNGTLFFSALDDVNGQGLWKSDGTAAGTVLVKDINPSANYSNSHSLTNVNGMLYFSAEDGVHGMELWKSDGTAAGTVLVQDIFPGSFNGNPRGLTNVQGTLYFSASDDSTNRELWKSDGTAAGTVRVKDIRPGGAGASPEFLTHVNGMLYFSAEDGVNGRELWKSDGTTAGTVLVQDIVMGSGSSTPEELKNVNGTLYFTIRTASRWELWKSDGTAAGTILFKALSPIGSGPLYLTDVNGTAWFSINVDGKGTELWKSDGTPSGLVMIRDINTNTEDALPSRLTNVNGMLYFAARDDSGRAELWKSDGTTAGTVVHYLDPGAPSPNPLELTNVNGTLFFSASEGTNGRELWKSDGTAAGTRLVKDIFPGVNSSNPSNLTNVNGTLFFVASNGTNGQELWKSDGTAAGTVLVKDILPGSGPSSPSNLTNANGTLFFSANDGQRGTELWKSDGTTAGTVLVKDLLPGANDGSPQLLTNINGTLFFVATDDTNGQELWKSDGTAAGTVLVKDIFPGTRGSFPNGLTNLDGTLYLSATDGTNGQELWKSDGTAAGTVLVQDIVPGALGSNPSRLTNAQGTLYFSAWSEANGQELWKSDGTAAGALLVKDIFPGTRGSAPTSLMNSGSTLYFSADDGTTGRELWMSDGTAAGTVLVQDIFPGPTGSEPLYLTQARGAVFFSAASLAHGRELWAVGGDSVPPTVTCPAQQDALATSAAGATVTYPPATATDDQTASPRLTYSVASGALFPLGDTRVTVTATDDAGNTAQCGFTVSVLPPPPTVTAPVDGTSSLAPVLISGTALAGAEVHVLEGTTVLRSLATNTDGAFSGGLALESRVYSLRFVQTLNGFTSTPTGPRTVFVRPPPPSLSHPEDGLVTTNPSVPLLVRGLPDATLTVREGTAVLATLAIDEVGNFAGSLALGHGVHVLRFTQTTSGGTSDDVVRTVTRRPSAPVLTRPTSGTSLVGPTVRVEGTGAPGATAQVLEAGAVVGTFPVASGGTFVGDLALAYGPHQLTAVQVEGGQTSPASAPVSFEVRPAAPQVSSPTEGATFDGPTVAVTGTGAPGAQVQVREARMVLASFAVGASGDFSGEVELEPGTHSLSFVQKAGGATSDATGPRNVSVRPAAPVLSSPAANARVLGPQVLLQGTALAGARVFAEQAGVALGSTSADAARTFRLSVTLAYGPHSIALRQERGGATSLARTAAFTVIPAPPVLSQPLDGATVGNTVEVRGTALPRARVTLRDGAEVLAQLDADTSGTFLLDVSLSYGPHTLTAVQRVQGEDSDPSAPVHLTTVFNRAPVADAQELSVEEDGRLAVTLTAQDADDDALTFSVGTPPAHGSLEGTPPALTYVPAPDFHGADRFTFAVSDGQAEATATVRLTVTPVNDAPVAHALSATTGEGQSISLTLSGSDIDGDTLTYVVVTAPEHGGLQGTPPALTYTPAPGFAGTDFFTFRVKDGQLDSPPATVSLRVLATALTVSVSDLSPLEGSPVAFSATLADASATPVFSWDFGDGTTSTEPAPRHAFPDNGVYTVRVSATDADGTRQASVVLTVRNAPPVVTSLFLYERVLEAQEVKLSALAEDPAGDADTLTYTWDFGDGSPPALGSTVRHAFRDDGAFTVVLTVRDEDGGETWKQATLTVTNVPPTTTAPERQFIQVGESLSLQLAASDVAGEADPLTWTKLSGPGAVTPEGLFTWVPTAQEVGEASIELQVSDDEGGSAEVTLVVEVSRLETEPPAGCGCGTSGDASGLLALLGLGLLSGRRAPRSRGRGLTSRED